MPKNHNRNSPELMDYSEGIENRIECQLQCVGNDVKSVGIS